MNSFKNLKFSTPKKPSQIIIVHCWSVRESKGHIVSNIVNVIKAFESRNMIYSLIVHKTVLDNVKYHLDIQGYHRLNLDNISTITNGNLKDVLNDIIDSSHINNKPKIIYLSWWTFLDKSILFNLDEKLLELNIKWSTFAHVSTHLRKNKISEETVFLNFVSKLKSVKNIFYWDTLTENFFEDYLRKVVCRIPEYNYTYNFISSPKSSNNFSVMFPGVQSAKRGIILFTWLAFINPNVLFKANGTVKSNDLFFPRANKIYLVGRFVNKLFTRIIILMQKSSRNLVRTNVYYDDEVEFQKELGNHNVIFTAGHLSPYSSGVSLLAIALRIPVIWTQGNSANSDQMRESYPLGRLLLHERVLPFQMNKKLKRLGRNTPMRELYHFEEFAQKFCAQFFE